MFSTWNVFFLREKVLFPMVVQIFMLPIVKFTASTASQQLASAIQLVQLIHSAMLVYIEAMGNGPCLSNTSPTNKHLT